MTGFRSGGLRVWLLLLLVALAAGGVGAGWWYYSAPRLPEPPLLPPEGIDPLVLAGITKARNEVLENRRSDEKWGDLGRVYTNYHHLTEAGFCFEVAQGLNPNSPYWPYMLGHIRKQYDAARAKLHFQRAKEVADKHSSADEALLPRFALAELYMVEGDLKEAEKELDELEKGIGPARQRLQFDRGVLASLRQEWTRALDLLLPLADEPATKKRAPTQLAVVFSRLGDPEAAARYSALAASRTDEIPWPDPWIHGTAPADLSVRTALVRIQQLAEKEKNFEQAMKDLNDLHERTGGQDVRILETRGVLEAGQGRLGKARDAYLAAIELRPDSSRAPFLLASMLRRQAKETEKDGVIPLKGILFLDEAIKYATMAVRLNPYDPQFHLLLGEVHMLRDDPKQDDQNKAVESLRKAADGRPEEPAYQLFYAEALARKGDREAALRQFERAVKVAGTNPAPAEELAKWRKKWAEEKR